jgi:hypothetical protein
MLGVEQHEIASLSDKTQVAHSTYAEQPLEGTYDQDWAAWHATYLVGQGIGDLMHQAITTEELTQLFKQYGEDYRSQQQDWLDYYAAQLLGWVNRSRN